MDTKSNKKGIIFILTVVLASLAFQLYEIDEQWVGLKDYNGAIYGIMSRNFVKHGYLRTRFGPAINTGPVRDDEFTYYLHHPPLFYFLVSFSYRIFGVSEWSARLVPILFSIMSLIFFFKLIRKIWGIEEAYFSTLLLAFLPMNLYFSRVFLQESSITLGVVLILWYYVRWRESRIASDYWKIVVLFAFFGLLDWPAYYILPLLTLHTLIVDKGIKSPGKLRILLLPLFGLLLFSINMVYVSYLSVYQGGGGLLDAFIMRSAAKTPLMAYSLIDFMRHEVMRGNQFFTPIVPVLSLVWLITFLRKRADIDRNIYVILLLLFGSIHVVLFQDAAYVHEFWLYHFSTGLALSSGLALTDLSRNPHIAKTKVIHIAVTMFLPSLFILYSAREVVSLHRIGEWEDLVAAGVMINDRSHESDRLIVHWQDPLPRAYGEYFRYYGAPIYSKPHPNLAYYADRNIRWGLKDLQDFESLLDGDDPYSFFLSRISYLRDGMDDEVEACLFEHFEPLFMLSSGGKEIDESVITSFLQGEDIPVEEGVIVFGRKTDESAVPLPN